MVKMTLFPKSSTGDKRLLVKSLKMEQGDTNRLKWNYKHVFKFQFKAYSSQIKSNKFISTKKNTMVG